MLGFVNLFNGIDSFISAWADETCPPLIAKTPYFQLRCMLQQEWGFALNVGITILNMLR
jgi:hypothetical protein